MMRALAQRIRVPQIKCNFWTSVFYVIVIFFLIFSIVNFKFQCIKLGYSLNGLHSEIQKEMIIKQNLELQENKYVNRNNLYKKAKSLGLEFPTGDKVFYVE